MTEEQKKIIELINLGFSCNQICKSLNITNKQLYSRLLTLKNKGIEFEKKYFGDGNLLYTPIKTTGQLIQTQKEIVSRIITRPSENQIKLMVISDIHIGSSFQRLDLLDRVYDYCVKEGIHIIFNCGDLIDGTFGDKNKIKVDPFDQIDYLIKKYPFDANILNFCVGGDHDLSVFEKCGQNITEVLKNYRHDIIMTSFSNSIVDIKKTGILLHHHTDKGKKFNEFKDYPIYLIGHTHKAMNANLRNNKLEILVPSLSDLNYSIPSAIEMTLCFQEGFSTDIILKQIVFTSKGGCILNQTPFILKPKMLNYNANEENYDFGQETIPEKIDMPKETKVKRLNQIEKFNRRYGI